MNRTGGEEGDGMESITCERWWRRVRGGDWVRVGRQKNEGSGGLSQPF